MAICHCLLPTVTITICHCFTTCHHLPPSVIVCHYGTYSLLQPVIMRHHLSLSVTICHCHYLSPSVTVCNHLPSIVTICHYVSLSLSLTTRHYLSPSVTVCNHLSSVVTICHYVSLSLCYYVIVMLLCYILFTTSNKTSIHCTSKYISKCLLLRDLYINDITNFYTLLRFNVNVIVIVLKDVILQIF